MPNFLQEDYGIRQSMADTTYPSSGTWNLGDYVLNSAPAIGQPVGWVCTTAGTPGTWTPTHVIGNVGATPTSLSAAGSAAVTANIVNTTGAGAFNVTLGAPTSVNNGIQLSIVNTSSGTVTAVAATGAAIVGAATVATLTSGTFKSNGTNWYRI